MSRRPLALALAILFAASAALARTTFHDLAVADAVQNGAGRENLLAIRFFMAGEKHAAVAKDLGTFTANKRTNAFNKSDEAACQIAFLSAVISLQSRAQQLGGDAVVDIRSITRNQELVSATQYRCVAGTTVANVALSGRVVKLR
jgi:hypothetical protein